MRIDAPPRLLAMAERVARARTSGVLATMLAVGALVDPRRPLPIDLCLLKSLTGVPCPTCGLTRAVCHVLRGDVMGSLAFHPAGVLVVAGVAGWIAWSAIEAWSGRALLMQGQRALARAAGAAIALTSLLSWLSRL